jgi:hypothetical protein
MHVALLWSRVTMWGWHFRISTVSQLFLVVTSPVDKQPGNSVLSLWKYWKAKLVHDLQTSQAKSASHEQT